MPDYEAQETHLSEPLAFDRSERFKDQDGHLHVRNTNLSKACINPYRGREIPGYEALGLDPERIYQLFRDPKELEKAAPTFNNLRLMSKHVAVSASDPQEKLVAGSTGTDARFEDPYLVNSLVVWRKDDIDDVESQEKCQLSCGYYYTPDMTPGEHQGLRYDGVMRDIRGNHVALVEAGRAGPDVLVHDSLKGITMPLASRKALLVKGALTAYLRPLLMPGTTLALDQMLGTVNGTNWQTQKPIVLAAVTSLARPRLAMDAKLDGLEAFIGALDEEDDDKAEDDEDDMEAMDAAEEEEETKAREKEEREGKSAADRKKGAMDRRAARDAKRTMDKKAMDAKRAKDKKGKDGDLEKWAKEEEDEPNHADDKAKDKKAMDEAIGAAEARVIARMTAAAEAREVVRPFVGQVSIALDSAAGIYQFALTSKGIDLAGVDPSAFKVMAQKMLPALQAQPPRRLALDSAHDGGLDAMFPAISRITQS
jgi:uncharacterized protein